MMNRFQINSLPSSAWALRASSLAAASLMLCTVCSNAAIITQFGDDVSFTYDDATPFGVGQIVGNALSFSPANFVAEAIGPNDSQSDTLVLEISVSTLGAQQFVDVVGVQESGDYVLEGPTASVSLNASLDIDLDQDNIVDLVNGFSSTAPLTNNDGQFHNWAAFEIADISSYSDSSITLVLTNELYAETFSGDERAFIQKKLDNVGISVAVIPLPASAWLLLSAIAAPLLVRRAVNF